VLAGGVCKCASGFVASLTDGKCIDIAKLKASFKRSLTAMVCTEVVNGTSSCELNADECPLNMVSLGGGRCDFPWAACKGGWHVDNGES
jgi:hypothetical protein